MANKTSKEGFTLVELIIVIAIIAILAVTIVPFVFRYIDNSRKADDVNKPFITIEIFSGKRPHLTQAFHRFNTPCTNEEWEWINEYCDRHNIMKREEFSR